MNKLEKKLIILETIIPQIQKDIKRLFELTDNIQKNITVISTSITEIETKLKNQYTWIDKWKLIVSGVMVSSGILGLFFSVFYYFYSKQ